MRSPWHEAPRRRAGWYALIAGVIAVHLLFGVQVAASIIGWDAGGQPRRIDVALVKELAPAAPPPVATVPAPVAPPPAERAPPAPRAEAAASQPDDAASAAPKNVPPDDDAPPGEARALLPIGERPEIDPGPPPEAAAAQARASAERAAALSALLASGAASAPPAASAASIPGPPQPALDWPPSTRLLFALTGQYRGGPLTGDGTVEWRRDGAHYQVEFDYSIALAFNGHQFSDGRVGADGLRPVHYEEWRKFPLHDRLVKKIEFGDDEVQLNNGRRATRLPQTQDPSSQFVQFVWMFNTHPELLKEGTAISIPLALPNNLRIWHYRVDRSETLQLPFGAIDAVHLVPTDPRKPNELPFEIWIAPSLQYLPVRIHVPVNDESFADLTLRSPPLQAAGAASAPPAAPPGPVFLPSKPTFRDIN